jgi:hypothetical protein
MRVYRGTYERDGSPVHWVETRTKWEFTLDQLIDGLCSHYHRNRIEGDDPFPEKLTATAVVRTVREQYEEHGTANVCTWSDSDYGSDREDHNKARAWARELILAVLPDLDIPIQ